MAAFDASSSSAALLAAASRLSTADMAEPSSSSAGYGSGFGSGGLISRQKENGTPVAVLGMGVATVARPWRQASTRSLRTSSAGRAAILLQTITLGVGVDISRFGDGSEDWARSDDVFGDDLLGFNMKEF